MAQVAPDYDKPDDAGEVRVKVICLGDSAVGKSKLVERFLMDGYKPQQLSTFALTLFNHKTEMNGQKISVEFCRDKQRSESNRYDAEDSDFETDKISGTQQGKNVLTICIHPTTTKPMPASCYTKIAKIDHCPIHVTTFDVTRKVTYKNMPNWLKELREYRPEIPCLCAANKIDVDPSVTKKSFNFAKKHNMPFYYVSASDGTNVVKLFRDAIKAASKYKANPTDIMDEIMQELENFELETGDSKKDGDEEQAAGGDAAAS